MAISEESDKHCRTNAGGSKALFMGAETKRGLISGCVAKRKFDPQYVVLLQEVHVMAACCMEELPCLGHVRRHPRKGLGLESASTTGAMSSISTTP